LAQWARKNPPPGCDPEKITARYVCEEAEKGQDWARCAVEHEAYYLGLGLANIVNIFTPQAILLGGSVMKSAHLFMDRIHEVIRLNCRLVPHERVDIEMATLGADVGLIGAAQVWHHRFQNSGGRLV
jgi:glucokinase